MNRCYLYGASGHAKVVASVLESNNIQVEGVYDDNAKLDSFLHYNFLGNYNQPEIEYSMVISIGNNKIRKKIASTIACDFISSSHPSAMVDQTVTIGNGTIIMQNCTIQAYSKIGSHNIINSAACIDHECFLSDFVHVSPNATLCGNVTIEEGAHIGAGSVIIQGIKIGKWATIGAGTVVLENVPDYAVVVGNPGRIIKYNEQ